MFFRRICVAVASVALLAGGLVAVAPPAAAGACYLNDNPTWRTSAWSGSSAGVLTEYTTTWYDRYQCLIKVYFAFQDSSGATIHSGNGQVSHSGETAIARISWTPSVGVNSVTLTATFQNTLCSDYSVCGESRRSWYEYDSLYPVNTIANFTALPAPSAPSAAQLVASNRDLTVSWSPPATNAGAVSKYVVTRAETGEVLCDVPASTLACASSGVPDGAYTYRVESRNQLGLGAATQTNSSLVAPPQPPSFTSQGLGPTGRNIEFTWDGGTGTSAVAQAFRVYDGSGVEVCGVAATAPLFCAVAPPKSGSTYTLKLETAMGDSVSAPTGLIKPDPDAFFKTCSKVSSAARECAIGKAWTFAKCTKASGAKTAYVQLKSGSKLKTVKKVKAKKSSSCAKKKPYLTKFTVKEKKKGKTSYIVILPDKSKKAVSVKVLTSP